MRLPAYIAPVIIPGRYGVRTAEGEGTVHIVSLALVLFKTWRNDLADAVGRKP